jgi:hypothetical protein
MTDVDTVPPVGQGNSKSKQGWFQKAPTRAAVTRVGGLEEQHEESKWQLAISN